MTLLEALEKSNIVKRTPWHEYYLKFYPSKNVIAVSYGKEYPISQEDTSLSIVSILAEDWIALKEIQAKAKTMSIGGKTFEVIE